VHTSEDESEDLAFSHDVAGFALLQRGVPLNSRHVASFDSAAQSFERHRQFPAGIGHAIRSSVLAMPAASRPARILDLGAGTGRIGRAFVEFGDAYIGIDLSISMMREFTARSDAKPALVQAEGQRLPFADGAFDLVLLMQVLSGVSDWRKLLAEARRVLKRGGAVIVGHTVDEPFGMEARLKARLAEALAELGANQSVYQKLSAEPLDWLRQRASGSLQAVAARWTQTRTPREFLARKPTGHRFGALAPSIQEAALAVTSEWAVSVFGSLDTPAVETRSFELNVFTFGES
jgi:ubiquinone/menaquinone biosynthesis C-methylase UbiE